MKEILVLTTLLLVAIPSFAEEDLSDDMFYIDTYILILKSTKDYDEAIRFATEASEKLGLEFENEHIRYSEEKGIYYAETLPDLLYRGGYYPRRYGDEYISLENSSGYDGFTAGYIIVVGGIYSDKESSEEALDKVRRFYKDAYIKKANMWMGCIH